MSAIQIPYPIGTAGIAWGDSERALWLASQTKQRSYALDVLSKIVELQTHFETCEYGQIDYGAERYPLVALKSLHWQHQKPVVLVTGGVHGYETSGVHGALAFLAHSASAWTAQVNLLVVPCVSPWAYERVNRWNAQAIDPNRSFKLGGTAAESLALMRLIAPYESDFSRPARESQIVLHVDLHETTDTDESEFRPALAARDGKPFEPGLIPDGFYLVGDVDKPELAFQQAVLAEVAKVTHIAPADANGEIIGATVVAPGVILYPCKPLGLCAGMTNAKFVSTTEVYPDSKQSTPEQCNSAQVAAINGAISYALANQS